MSAQDYFIKPLPRANTEFAGMRTPTSKTFDSGGGLLTLRQSLTAVHYPDPDQGNTLQEVDPKVVIDRGRPVVRKAWYDMQLLDAPKLGFRFVSKRTGTIEIELLELDGLPVVFGGIPRMAGNEIWFDDVGLDLDIYFDMRPAKVEVWRILKTSSAPKTLKWEVREGALDNVRFWLPAGGNDNVDRNDRGEKFRRRIIDYTAVPTEKQRVGDEFHYQFTEQFSGQTLKRRLADRVFEKRPAEETLYPVIIDTTVNEDIVETNDDGAGWGSPVAWNATGSPAAYTGIWIGSYTNNYYPGWRFQSVNVPQGSSITSATLTLVTDPTYVEAATTETLVGYDTDSSPAWDAGTGIDPESMTPTTATASMTTPAATSTSFDTTITSIFDEVNDRAGWTTSSNFSIGVQNPASATYCGVVDYGETPANSGDLEVVYAAAGGIAPTSHLLGPLWGPLGGPIA